MMNMMIKMKTKSSHRTIGSHRPPLLTVAASLWMICHTILLVDPVVFVVVANASHEVDARLPLRASNVHWGYFSRTLTPALTISSGQIVEVEMATHHACDDWDKMIKGDGGMEDIFTWNTSGASEPVRGATGGGDGVHVLTGPIYVTDAEPGDILQVEILELVPRRNSQGKTYGSNAAAWWGYQARVSKADGTPYYAGSFTKSMPGENDEIVTIYEVVDAGDGTGYAVPAYQFEWPILTDPMNVTRDFIAYPGTCVPHDPHGCDIPSSDVTDMGWTKTGDIVYYDDVYRAKIPINYHIGCMGLAPGSHDFVDSIPPMPTGGNLDNRRIGIGMTMYYPVEVTGAMLSMGDAHAAQGDSELDGTGIETSLTGTLKITVIKASDFTASQRLLNFPLGETETEYVVHGFTETDYLETYSDSPGDIYGASSIDKAMMNAFTQTRMWVMAHYNLTEAEATTIITQGVDFAITQIVDGNWGVHAVIPKSIFVPMLEDDMGVTVSSEVGTRKLEDGVYLALSPENVHWGFFSKTLEPVLTVDSGTEVTVEMATHHACDDWDRMIMGDAAMEAIYTWNASSMGEVPRGATGTGDGVHILTGPIYVNGAEPGDILKVDILDLVPRAGPGGKTYGSNAAAWWGFQGRTNKVDGTPFTAGNFTGTPDQNDEMVTIYEIVDEDSASFAVPLYQYEWPVVTDPMGVTRNYIAFPGTCVPHDAHGTTVPSGDVVNMGWTKENNITYYDNVFRAKIPINYHVGCMGLAPASHDFVDSIPPMPTGGNLDNRRIGIGTTMYYPIEVAGGLISMGDTHAAQGDSELDGTGIETSLIGKFKLTVIKQADFTAAQKLIDFPLGETLTEWIVHGFTATDYLETFADSPGDIYGVSSIDNATRNCFTQTRKFVIAEYNLTEVEAWTIITQGVNFGITQVVDGNWGVHAVIPKAIFQTADPVTCAPAASPTASTSGVENYRYASEFALMTFTGIAIVLL